MAPPLRGRNTRIMWGTEVTWGTPVAVTHGAPAITANLQRKRIHEDVPHLLHADDATIQESIVAREEAGGSLEFAWRYEEFGYLLEAWFGTVSTTGTGPYAHAYTTAITTLKSVTIEQTLGNSGNEETFEGCKVNQGELSIEAGGAGRLTFEIIAETGAAITGSPTSFTFPSSSLVLHRQMGSFTFNSVTYPTTSMRIRMGNSLARHYELGSDLTVEPGVDNFRTPEIVVTVPYRVDTLYVAHTADTSAAFSVAFTGTGNDAIAIAGVNCQVVNIERNFSSPGTLLWDYTLRPRGSGSTGAWSLTVTNDQANHYD